MRIFLIGMPGVGKTEIGEMLANRIGYTFVDLDSEIEKDSLMFIEDIFYHYGEETFRNAETDNLKKITTDNVVVATGGGIVLRKENIELMNGKIIYLYADIDKIKERIDYERPLLRDKSLEELYEERKNLYEEYADYKVENNDIEECLERIMKVI